MAKSERKSGGRAGESTVSGPEFSHAEIARRAYEVYLARGAAPGRDLDDWLQADAGASELDGGPTCTLSARGIART